MVSKNLAAYEPAKQTRAVILHWRLPEEWAEVLHEWVQRPLPPPIGAGAQVFRPVDVAGGSFGDWLAPHDARAYRFRR